MLNQLNNLENLNFEDKRLLHSNIIAQLTHPRLTINGELEYNVNNLPSRNSILAKLSNELSGQLPTGATNVRYRITHVENYATGLFKVKGQAVFDYRHSYDIHQITPTLATKRASAQALQTEVDRLHAETFGSVSGYSGIGSWAQAEALARAQLPAGAINLVITRTRTPNVYFARTVTIDYRIFSANYRNKQTELRDTKFEIGFIQNHLTKQKALSTHIDNVVSHRDSLAQRPETERINIDRDRLQLLVQARQLAIDQQTQRLHYLENLRHQSTTLARQQREARDLIKLTVSQRNVFQSELSRLDARALALQPKKKKEEEQIFVDEDEEPIFIDEAENPLTAEERTQVTKLTRRIDQRRRQLYERLESLTNPRLTDADFEQELKAAEKYEGLIEARQTDLDAIRLPSEKYLQRRTEIKTIQESHKQQILTWRGELKQARIDTKPNPNPTKENIRLDWIRAMNWYQKDDTPKADQQTRYTM